MTIPWPQLYRSRTRDFFMDQFDFQKHDDFFAKLLELFTEIGLYD